MGYNRHMDDNEQPKLSISQEAFERYTATHSAPELSGGVWTLDVEWNPAPPEPERRPVSSVIYNGVDLTEQARGLKIEIPLAVVSTRDHGVEMTMKFELTQFDAVRLMRVFGVRRRIWATRKHKRPRGRVVVLD